MLVNNLSLSQWTSGSNLSGELWPRLRRKLLISLINSAMENRSRLATHSLDNTGNNMVQKTAWSLLAWEILVLDIPEEITRWLQKVKIYVWHDHQSWYKISTSVKFSYKKTVTSNHRRSTALRVTPSSLAIYDTLNSRQSEKQKKHAET